MRTRTAKKLAQRIDLNYFKRRRGLGRWQLILSIASPLMGLLWLGGMAAAGSRAPYSSGPVSPAHAFVENKCEVCHRRDAGFRAHVGDTACLTCHAAPEHAMGRTEQEQPACASCHREHRGRVELARTVADGRCLACHADLRPGDLPPTNAAHPPLPPTTPAAVVPGPWPVVGRTGAFPAEHPEFAVLREAFKDPGTIRFNHEVHARPDLRGPNGPETLECTTCHKPQIVRTGGGRGHVDDLMESVTYGQQCARCHPLFFDERLDVQAPHGDPRAVSPAVRAALAEYIRRDPAAVSARDPAPRRLPLNFPQTAEPQARNAEEWVDRRATRAERFLFDRACAYCHGAPLSADGGGYSGPQYRPANIRTAWMGRARFDHTPHLVVECASCHAGAAQSRDTADVLMPALQTCATCHAPGKGASAQCSECHGYHDWTKAAPVKPTFTLSDFR